MGRLSKFRNESGGNRCISNIVDALRQRNPQREFSVLRDAVQGRAARRHLLVPVNGRCSGLRGAVLLLFRLRETSDAAPLCGKKVTKLSPNELRSLPHQFREDAFPEDVAGREGFVVGVGQAAFAGEEQAGVARVDAQQEIHHAHRLHQRAP